MFPCLLVKNFAPASCQMDFKVIVSTAKRRAFTKMFFPRHFSQPTHGSLSAAENRQSCFPSVCDDISSCILRKCPYVGVNIPDSHNSSGVSLVPTTCAAFPSMRTVHAPKLLKRQKRQQNPFEYSALFEEKIMEKRRTSTYRVFKRILRDSDNFPHAYDFTTGTKQRITIWCSNDYLGMSRHPSVRESAINAIRRYGVGSGGTRNISGNTLIHEALEHELAELHGKEAGLVFTSCFVANEAALYTLGTQIPEVQIFSDAGNHASMIHGIRTSGADKHIFRTFDLSHMDEKMKAFSLATPKLAVCETVHSMDGSIISLPDFLDVAERHNALTFVDEVHAVGLYGDHGAGVAEEVGCMHRVDAITGTLGKAFASIGGYLVGDSSLVDMIRSYAGGFIFTTSLPPPVLAAARASVAILRSDEGRQLRQEHRRRVGLMRQRLREAGLPVPDAPSHIVPIYIPDATVCSQISDDLLRHHKIYIQSINYPTVAKGTERLRIAPTPFHTDAMMDELVDALVAVWKRNGLQLHGH